MEATAEPGPGITGNPTRLWPELHGTDNRTTKSQMVVKISVDSGIALRQWGRGVDVGILRGKWKEPPLPKVQDRKTAPVTFLRSMGQEIE